MNKAVFIIGLPRSGTTHLFKLLASDRDKFHCFKLWELAFAPSIIQKYLWLGLGKLDKMIGRPGMKLILRIDDSLFKDFRGIHDIGFFKPEEDEALFMYNLSSIFLIYLFPEVKEFEANLFFDKNVKPKPKARNLDFYHRLLQRHKYVFDRDNKRYYLSKNPTFCSRIKSVSEKFKKAFFLIPDRSPAETIPSTISLNAHIYQAFCDLPETYPLQQRTREQVLDWHRHVFLVQRQLLSGRSSVIDYQHLTKSPAECLDRIYKLIGVPKSIHELETHCQNNVKANYRSPHRYPANLGMDKALRNKKPLRASAD